MSNDLTSWFSNRPIWLQEAANRLIQKPSLTGSDIDELSQLCQDEASGKAKPPEFTFSSDVFTEQITGSLHLCSIKDVQGINQLAPKKPLEFESNKLVVIFGSNGSGKSGYVRILKHACGARCPGALHDNIFAEPRPEQSCTITYVESGSEKTCPWNTPSGIIDQLRQVDIFDASCGLVYVTDENEVTYEPTLLAFFSDLVTISDHIAEKLRGAIQALVSKLPTLPSGYAETTSGKWYARITQDTKKEEISDHCSWNKDDAKRLSELQQRLSEESPSVKAQKLRTQKQHVDSLISSTQTHVKSLSNEACKNTLGLKARADVKKEAADTAAHTLFESVPLPGVGSDVWAELWEKAREYSESAAYLGKPFPVTDEKARCVLCQQELSGAARQRFTSFEQFIKGEMRKDADAARLEFDTAIEELGEIPSTSSLQTTMDAAGIAEEDAKLLEKAVSDLRKRQSELSTSTALEDLTALPKCDTLLQRLGMESQSLEDRACRYDEDAKGENRDELTAEKNELETQKWIHEQKKAIDEEVEQLRKKAMLESAAKLCDTTALSRKKGELADALITDAFAKRFSNELSQLRASLVKIKVVKTRVKKGHALHCLRWQDAEEGPVMEVLSEGESRIVSLSAFLADVAEKKNPGPFVFDDPISSLDQDFEEAVAGRLVELSADRQVIVFTHRLSLLSLLQELGKKAGQEPHVVCIKRETWGAGEPGDTPIYASKPHKALNLLLNERLPQAEKALNETGKDSYYPLAKAICSDVRILVERMIENDLLADVVQRFRRSVNIQGKIDKLAKISDADCTFLDGQMTKYSKYEHSQSEETPVELPDPSELKSDMESILTWRDEFLKRGSQ